MNRSRRKEIKFTAKSMQRDYDRRKKASKKLQEEGLEDYGQEEYAKGMV